MHILLPRFSDRNFVKSNVFTTELISRNIFTVRENFSLFHIIFAEIYTHTNFILQKFRENMGFFKKKNYYNVDLTKCFPKSKFLVFHHFGLLKINTFAFSEVSRKIGMWEYFGYFYIMADSLIKGQRSYHSSVSPEFQLIFTLIQISILLSRVRTNTFTFSWIFL